jgi:DNA-binding transcriptional MerR regulator
MTFKLEELAEAAGVSPRTVRYYVQRGLLPAPAFRGRDTVYDEDHLIKLRAIRRLQEQYLPLDAIQIELARRSRAELEEISKGAAPPRDDRPVLVPPPVREPEKWVRWELRPGVELLASERAGVTRELVDVLKQAIARHGAAGGNQNE